MAAEQDKQDKVDYDPQKDGTPERAYKATQRSFWQSINNPGYIAAGITTILIAGQKAISAFMKRLSYLPGYKEHFEQHTKELANAHKNANGNFEEFSRLKNESAEKLNENVLRDLKKNIGMKDGLAGLYQKFRVLETHEKTAYLLSVATVASVAIGAITSFRRERKLSDEIHHQIANRADDNSTPQTLAVKPKDDSYQARLASASGADQAISR